MKREREEKEQVREDTSITTVEKEKESPEKKAKPSEVENSCSDIACFGAGCYWLVSNMIFFFFIQQDIFKPLIYFNLHIHRGTEQYIKNRFTKLHPNAIVDGKVGFMGPEGSVENPNYKEVCSG